MAFPYDTQVSSAVSQIQPQQAQIARPKRAVACNYCRTKKIRCSGGENGPCTNCLDRNQHCTSTAPRRWRTRDRSRGRSEMSERLKRVEALLKQQIPSPIGSSLDPVHEYPTHLRSDDSGLGRGNDGNSLNSTELRMRAQSVATNPEASQTWKQACATISPPQMSIKATVAPDRVLLASDPKGADATASTLEWGSACAQSTPLRDRAGSEGPEETSPEEFRERTSISSTENSNWEYHGPRSFLSICSRPGIKWVASKTGSSTFNTSARAFTSYITGRLKMENMLSRERKPEPDEETASRYTQAFFDEALESALGIVHRPWFEAQLKNQFSGAFNHGGLAWYALRNAVYASGCRIDLSKRKSFREANEAAWGWFENALSVHTEILYFRTSIMGVQALTLMAYFTQNFGSPCLEYALCGTAVRLGIAKGLHRQAVPSCNLSEHETSLRSCLFWATYCLEKQIVCQSGRHSLIDDDDISCPTPTVVPHGSTVNIEYFNLLIRLARLSSSASKRLSTVRAYQQGVEALVRSVTELDEQVRALKCSIDPVLSLSAPPNPSQIPSRMTLQQTTYLRYVFFSLTLDIHTSLTYPWIRNMLGLTPHAALRDQVEISAQIVAETCRSAILATEHIHFDATTPVPLSLFGPIYALINLFIYILQNPQTPGVQSDLALLEVGAGYFARVQFATASEVSIGFAREMASLAHEATERARQPHAGSMENTHEQYLPSGLPQNVPENVVDREMLPGDYLSHYQATEDMSTFSDLELEKWSTLIPGSFDESEADFPFF